MNNTRRKAISEVSQKVGNVKSEVESIMQDIESIKGEEEDYKDNIPENLQGARSMKLLKMPLKIWMLLITVSTIFWEIWRK